MNLKAILKKFLPTPAQTFTNEINSLHSDIHLLHEEITTLKNYCLDPKLYPYALKLWYQDETGDYLDLENPQSFNEKIQWLKLYDSTPLKTRLADKYLVRDWVQEKIGSEYLVPLLGVWDRFDDIDFSELPDSFVLKCNHGSGWNVVVKDKKSFDINAAKTKFNKWMKTNYAFQSFELHYKDISRKIIAEKYLEQFDGNLLDYKIHVFNGVPKIIQIIGDRDLHNHKAKESFLTIDWAPISLPEHTYDSFEKIPDKPENLNNLLKIASVLGEKFSYVRVDLFDVSEKIYFGEMTFAPGSGTAKWGRKRDSIFNFDIQDAIFKHE